MIIEALIIKFLAKVASANSARSWKAVSLISTKIFLFVEYRGIFAYTFCLSGNCGCNIPNLKQFVHIHGLFYLLCMSVFHLSCCHECF